MNKENELSCVVSGSIRKFKPEIDTTIDEFTALGVRVLSPEKGWILKPQWRIVTLEDSQFRRLPGEKGMSIREIEDHFLKCLAGSHFVYIENPEGYAGIIVSMETGFAMALGKPVYSRYPISSELDPDPLWKQRISQVQVLTPEQVVMEYHKRSS